MKKQKRFFVVVEKSDKERAMIFWKNSEKNIVYGVIGPNFKPENSNEKKNYANKSK